MPQNESNLCMKVVNNLTQANYSKPQKNNTGKKSLLSHESTLCFITALPYLVPSDVLYQFLLDLASIASYLLILGGVQNIGRAPIGESVTTVSNNTLLFYEQIQLNYNSIVNQYMTTN